MMKQYTVLALDEFEVPFTMGFETLSAAEACFNEWFEANESGETPLYALDLLEGSKALKSLVF